MFRFLLVLAVCAGIATSCGSTNVSQLDTPSREVSAVNATNAWNSVCAQYHFIPKPENTSVTFSQGYYGQDFNLEFAQIVSRVNAIVQDALPPTDGSDIMKFKIENWGRVGGGM